MTLYEAWKILNKHNYRGMLWIWSERDPVPFIASEEGDILMEEDAIEKAQFILDLLEIKRD